MSEAKYYPRLTLLFQALGTLLMGVEAALRCLPDILIDTQGCAFAYPFFWLAKCHVVAYIHYPFVGSDLLQGPDSGAASDRQRRGGLFAQIRAGLGRIRTNYYRFVAKLYSYCGQSLSVAMVNSAWTREHMKRLWTETPCQIVYPPCDLEQMQRFDASLEREPLILSLSQFRPEKNQAMQIHILKGLLEARPEWRGQVKLHLYGGCRNAADRRRASDLTRLAATLGIADSVHVHTDTPHEEILAMLSKAMIGLHTMREEHFGIGIVEFMASGVITVAHRSGGPKMDIIRSDDEGCLCAELPEYVETLEKIIAMPESRRRETRERARTSAVTRFSGAVFESAFVNALAALQSPSTAKASDPPISSQSGIIAGCD